MKKDITVPEKLLLAAFTLHESGKERFTAEDLVVAAWRSFPSAFGLAGYANENGKLRYPDSNRVFAEVMGSKPIRKRGYLTKVGKKMYQLTPSGIEAARRLRESNLSDTETHSKTRKSGLSRDLKRELSNLIRSRAVQKVENDQHNAVSFQDACMFWGINPRSKAIELEGQLSHFQYLLAAAYDEVNEGDVSLEHGGSPFGKKTLDLLQQTDEFLKEQFRHDLEVIRSRTDQRKR